LCGEELCEKGAKARGDDDDDDDDDDDVDDEDDGVDGGDDIAADDDDDNEDATLATASVFTVSVDDEQRRVCVRGATRVLVCCDVCCVGRPEGEGERSENDPDL
jgi:hypothetical protein